MPPQPNPRSGVPATQRGAAPQTAALFVRIPAEHARRLDRAAFELRVPKQSLVSELVDRYVDPDSPASLQALAATRSGSGADQGRGRSGSGADRDGSGADGDRRRVTVETLDQGGLTLGHHAFRPATPEVLTAEDTAELLQVEVEVVLELARSGELPGRELQGEWRFARSALLGWLAAGDARSAPEQTENAGGAGAG